jgi:hypothetical protein
VFRLRERTECPDFKEVSGKVSGSEVSVSYQKMRFKEKESTKEKEIYGNIPDSLSGDKFPNPKQGLRGFFH